ncbi:MAG: TetR/AcrR family transcriptional regulator [Pseudomonadota bacterium]
MAQASIAAKRKKRPTRQEKAEQTYQRLMDAAAEVVGEQGYAQASIAKITDRAGIAHGTFYNYFEDRQALFDALLPHVGHQMTDHITDAIVEAGFGPDREVARFRAFCTYLVDNPGFYRILFEAEVFAPRAHAAHIDRLVDGYRRAFERSIERGDIADYDPDELETLIFALLGARAYVAMRFVAENGSGPKTPSIPDSAISAYEKLMRRGLFGKPKTSAPKR